MFLWGLIILTVHLNDTSFKYDILQPVQIKRRGFFLDFPVTSKSLKKEEIEHFEQQHL